MKKGVIALGLMLVIAGLGIKDVSAIASGSMSCNSLKTALSSDNSSTGTATIKLAEDCKADNIYIKEGQIVTFDPAGHKLEADINVESNGELTISASGTPGVIDGKLNVKGKLSISGNSFSSDPSKYLAEGYATSVNDGVYVVTLKSEASASFDTSKITGSNENIRDALIKTLEAYIKDPDTSSENGRKIAQLLNSVRQGHTLAASIVINSDPEISENTLVTLLDETAGGNLASVNDVKFSVTDTTDSNASVVLNSLAAPVTVVLPIPNQYKAALASHVVEILHINSENQTNIISNVRLDANGDVAFETTEFSVFAMTYDGEPITATAEGDDYVPQSTNVVASATTSSVAPDTAGFLGIDLTVFNLVVIIGTALVVIALVAYAGKRAYIRSRISWK